MILGWIRPGAELGRIALAVSVEVAGPIARETSEIGNFPVVRHPVSVRVSGAEPGDENVLGFVEITNGQIGGVAFKNNDVSIGAQHWIGRKPVATGGMSKIDAQQQGGAGRQ